MKRWLLASTLFCATAYAQVVNSPPTPPFNVLNVQAAPFNAVCDDVADDTAAINAAFAQVRTNQHSGPAGFWGGIAFPQGKACKITGPINATGLTGASVVIEGHGSTIDCHATGAICLDALSSRWLKVHDLTIVGDAVDTPKIGMQIGRITPTGSADNHAFHDVLMWGAFTLTDVYNLAAETTLFDNVRLYNSYASANAYCLIQDGYNHFAASSSFVTETITPDTALSFNEDTFVTLDMLPSGGGPAMWLGKTYRHSFIGSYIGKTGTTGPAIVLYGEGGTQNKYLNAAIHIEAATFITDAFLVSGTDASQTIEGLSFSDFAFQGSNSILKADTGVTSVALPDVDIQVNYQSSANLFDTGGHAASIWTATGRYYSPAMTQFNSIHWQGSFLSSGQFVGSGGYLSGSGAIQAQIADSTSTGGNSRGANAVDWQMLRSGAAQVASGLQAAIVGGNSNQAGGFAAVAGGNNNTAGANAATAFGQTNSATGQYSRIPGGLSASDHGFYGNDCYASGAFAVAGDAQVCTMVLRGTGSSTSAIRLTSDGGAASAANCVNLPANTGMAISDLSIMAYDHTTVTINEEWGGWKGLLTRGATAGSTAVKMDATPTPQTNGTVTGSAIAVSADTTFACLNVSFTPPTSNTDTWNVVAHVRAVEVQ